MIITAAQSADLINTLTTAIRQHMAAGAKLSKTISALCALPRGVETIADKNEFIQELAQIFTSARQQGAAKLPDGDKVAMKSFTNSWGYAMRVAGTQLGVKFQYAQHKGLFEVQELAAPSEPAKVTASGVESAPDNQARVEANQDAANEKAALKLPALPAANDKSKAAKQARAARIEAAKKAVRGLLVHGFSAAELAVAFEAIVEAQAARDAGKLDSELAKVLAESAPANSAAA